MEDLLSMGPTPYSFAETTNLEGWILLKEFYCLAHAASYSFHVCLRYFFTLSIEWGNTISIHKPFLNIKSAERTLKVFIFYTENLTDFNPTYCLFALFHKICSIEYLKMHGDIRIQCLCACDRERKFIRQWINITHRMVILLACLAMKSQLSIKACPNTWLLKTLTFVLLQPKIAKLYPAMVTYPPFNHNLQYKNIRLYLFLVVSKLIRKLVKALS